LTVRSGIVSSGLLRRCSLSRMRCSKASEWTGASTWGLAMAEVVDNRGELADEVHVKLEQKRADRGGPMFEVNSALTRSFVWMHSCKWRTPVARYAACVTARKPSVRSIAHSHAHPSKLRNLAICAHIGGQPGTPFLTFRIHFLQTQGKRL
jgi:hypothetical protein